jgi:hypothetical protein
MLAPPRDAPPSEWDILGWVRLFAWAGIVSLGLAAGVAAEDLPAGPCFDFSERVTDPLAAPIPLVPGHDNHVFGTGPGGVVWASGRVVLDVPVAAAYASLLDHRNVKDMTKTTITTTVLDRPGYLAFHLVKIVVTLRALFLKMEVPWTEAWGFSLVEGTADAPRRIVASYQKVAGTDHIKHQCGSYVLQAREDGTTDLSLYEQIKADRRSARDTRDMHRGIVKNLRATLRVAGPSAPIVAIP